MNKSYLNEAFKQLEILEEEDFRLDDGGIDDMKSFVDNDEKNEFVDIIDPEAEDEEELEDSYIGKVILECEVCKSKMYKNADEVTLDDEEGLANVGEECPFCYSSDGYKVIGEVAPFTGGQDVDVEIEPKEENPDADVEDDLGLDADAVEKKPEDEDEKNEGLAGAIVGGAVGSAVGHPVLGAAAGHLAQKAIKNSKNATDEVQEEGLGGVLAGGILGGALGHPIVGAIAGNAIQNNLKNEDCDEECKDDTCCGKKAPKRESLSQKKRRLTKNEAFEKIELETDTEKIKIESEPKEMGGFGGEMIAPLGDENEHKFEKPEDEVAPEEPIGAQYHDEDVEDFGDEEFNGIGESYLKKVYENVESFKTSKVSTSKNHLTVEGIIKFNSGKEKKTQFVFEAKDITKDGKARFIGENKQISRGKKSFTLRGTLKESKFIAESLTYNYRAKNADGKSQRIYGTARVK